MNPYQCPCTCNVCGGPGMTHVRNRASVWTVGTFFVHTNPQVCADYLAAQKEREEHAREQATIMAGGAGI